MEGSKIESSVSLDRYGYLKKYTNYLNGFQRRYVVCHNGVLSYYRSDLDYPRRRRGHISLSHASLTESSKTFTITSNDSIRFTFKAFETKEHSNWVDTLRSAIKQTTERSGNIAPNLAVSSIEEIEDKIKKIRDNQAKTVRDLGIQFLSAVENTTKLVRLLKSCQLTSPEDVITGVAPHDNRPKHKHSHSISLIGQRKNNSIEQIHENIHKNLETLSAIWDEQTAAASFHSKRLYGLLRALIVHIKSVGTAEGVPLVGESSYPPEEMPENLNDSDSAEFFDAKETADESSAESTKGSKKCQSGNQCTLDISQPVVKGVSHTRSASETNICTSRKSSSKTNFRKTIPICEKKVSGLFSNMSKFLKYRGGNFSLPIQFFEPLSMLQRVTEAMEYSFLLDKAASCDNTHLQMCYVFAFMVSNYSTTAYRKLKPFNPLLCETFEMDRSDDLGWKSICEQVSHHPPIHALHVEGNGWIFLQTAGVNVQIGVTSIDVSSQGLSEVIFTRSGIHYDWNFVRTKVSGFFSGSVSLNHTGDVVVSNRSTGDICKACFSSSGSQKREVTAEVIDKDGRARYSLTGHWDRMIEYSIASPLSNEESIVTIDRKVIWTVNSLPKSAEEIYNFSEFTCSLNQPDGNVSPTDSRNRPDERFLEEGNLDKAGDVKHEVEEYQRSKRSEALKQYKDKSVKYEDILKPTWFEPDSTRQIKSDIIFHKYKGGYWEAKKNKDWSACPKIFP